MELKEILTIRMDEVLSLLNTAETNNRLKTAREEGIKSMIDRLLEIQNQFQTENVNKVVLPVPEGPTQTRNQNQSHDETIEELQETGRRILILGDSLCKGSSLFFKKFLSFESDVCTITKPNMVIDDLVECVDRLSKDYTKRDYVVVMAGRDSILQNRRCNFEAIVNKLKTLNHTNCIFVSVPYLTKRDAINNSIVTCWLWRCYGYVDDDDRTGECQWLGYWIIGLVSGV